MVYYIRFFNGHCTLQEALGLSPTGIIDLFYKIATDANPEGNNTKFRVHEEARACIQDAVNKINTIYMRYVDVKEAKTLDEYPGYIIVPEADPIRLGSLTVDYQGNKFELRTLYDIIGWIFSVLGNENAQVGATRENYYYPLMMIARVFSAKLISNAKAPDVWMVMWFKQTVNGKKVTRVVLGATLDDPSDIVKEETKEFRKGLLKREEVLIWMDGRLPPEQEQGPSGAIVRQDFGHCAETYPLLFICKLGNTSKDRFEIRKSAEGTSASTKQLYRGGTTIDPYMERNSKGKLELNKRIWPPCRNCGALLRMNDFTLANFDWDLYKTRPKVTSR